MALTPDATLGEAGEFGLISELVKIFEGDEHVLVGPGDDAVVFDWEPTLQAGAEHLLGARGRDIRIDERPSRDEP